MADDPADAFDRFADDIRRTQDELDAADKLRSEKAKRKRQPEDAADAAPDSDKPNKPPQD